MNKEIKEILDFKENADYKKLSCDEIAILRDYITDLQEELEEEKRINQEDLKLIDELQEKIKHYEETTTFGDYVKEVNLLVDYKSRIEKAVEYINNGSYFDGSSMCKVDLLDILNGRSDK